MPVWLADEVQDAPADRRRTTQLAPAIRDSEPIPGGIAVGNDERRIQAEDHRGIGLDHAFWIVEKLHYTRRKGYGWRTNDLTGSSERENKKGRVTRRDVCHQPPRAVPENQDRAASNFSPNTLPHYPRVVAGPQATPAPSV
jgi:hypothetical protein